MPEDDFAIPEAVELIRFALNRLGRRNAYHAFEELCLDFASARIGLNFVPATGPVGAGGDQGRDSETFTCFVASPSSGSVAPTPRIVGICSLTTSNPAAKVRRDLFQISSGAPVDMVYAFLEADLPIAAQHDLIDLALESYGIKLEIFDGHRLATQLALPDPGRDSDQQAHRRWGLAGIS